MSVVGLVSPQAYRGVAGSLRLAFLHAFMPVSHRPPKFRSPPASPRDRLAAVGATLPTRNWRWATIDSCSSR